MTESDLLAYYYDLEHDAFDDDVDLYRRYAEAAGAPVLDLACGTGRVAVPLAKSGFDVTGLDTSPAMLERARRRAHEEGVRDHVLLVQGDMSAFSVPRRGSYGLAVVALGSFALLDSIESQSMAVGAVARHLRPGGRFVLDLPNPFAVLFPPSAGEVVHQCTLTDDEGGRIAKLVSRWTNVAGQREDITLFYDLLGRDGVLRRLQTELSLRYPTRYEMQLLLEANGLTVEDIFGSYDLCEYDSDSERLVVVARRLPE